MNIFIRQQDSDLFKYLDDSELNLMVSRCQCRALAIGESISDPKGIVMLYKGILEKIDSTGSVLGRLYPGEIDFEIDIPHTLRAVTASQTSILKYDELELSDMPQISAKIQAAINDSLCLKIIRLTHKGEEDAPASK